MRRGNEDREKLMGPLFPRLHVNDAPEKGAPRAPPRNKMALYEQLSVPSPRSRSGVASTQRNPLHENGIHCASSSHGSDKERSHMTSFYIPHASSYSTDKVHSSLYDRGDANAAPITYEPKFNKTACCKASSSKADYIGVQKKTSQRKDCVRRQLRDEDDFTVPTFIEPQTNTSKEKAALLGLVDSGTVAATKASDGVRVHMVTSCDCASQLWRSQEKSSKRPRTADKNYRHSCQSKSHAVHGKQSDQVMQIGMVPVVESNEYVISLQNPGALSLERPKCVRRLQDQEQGTLSLNDAGSTLNEADLLGVGESNSVLLSYDNRRSEASVENIAVDVADGPDQFTMSNECRSAESPVNRNATPTNRSEPQPDNKDRNDDFPERMPTTVPASGQEISPDDIVGIIGPKQFWKARRAITNQQRIFSLQVFELHRLIKVQKYLAGSSHLLLNDDLYPTSPSKTRADDHVFPDEDSRSEHPIVKHKPEPPKFSPGNELSAIHSAAKTASMVDNIIEKEVTHQEASSYEHSKINPSPGLTMIDSETAPWCFPSLGTTQCLVPVMSPSEGLVYKPFTGLSPPVAGFMAPAYGTCLPMNPAVGTMDLSNMVYGVPPSYQQNAVGIGAFSGTSSYFPPYGLHVPNPMLTGRVDSEQADSPASNLFHLQSDKFPTENTINTLSRGSCNMPDPKTNAFSCQVGTTVREYRETELQGSTASTSVSCERVQETTYQTPKGNHTLPFLHGVLDTKKAVCTDPHGSEQQTQVIKVVPHNAKFATESAARIFLSIQKDREQHD